MQSHYFLVGNLWLIFGLLTIFGRRHERSSPDMYSFFGAGQYLSPTNYAVLIIIAFITAIFCFVMHAFAMRRDALHRVAIEASRFPTRAN